MEQLGESPLGKVLREVCTTVQNGGSLAEGLAGHPQLFSPVVIAMVRAGEVGGFLDQILTMVAGNLESELKLRRTVKSAMVYPVVILCATVAAVAGMLLFVVPRFEKIFKSLGADLPLPTRFLMGAASVATWATPVALVATIVLVWWWRRHKNDLSVRTALDPLKLRIPLFGSLLTKVAVARFCRALSTMTRVGVPIVQALEVTSEVAGNVVIAGSAERVREAVANGRPLAQAIKAESVFGPMVSQMVGAGEDSGSIDVMLDKVATFYEEEVDAATASLTSVIEPLLIIVVGGAVGSILIAMYLPIFQLSTGVN
jgi:type IV pilus assembly protein PilC